ncbi:chitinase, partial [Syncephalastrum racemosum]
ISTGLILTGYLATTALAGFPDTHSVVQYWGQNSGGGQQPLATYCDESTDALIMSFVNNFNIGSLPDLNLASSCKGTDFPNTNLLDCPQVGSDIKACQAKGKKILLSLGGATGSYGFQSDSQGQQFAETLWNLFGGGKSDTRPFGDAVVDGFDLDIESGGSTGYVAFVKALRKQFASDAGKTYYITGAPQCPFPDALLGDTLNQASFDAVNVQFYNNYCAIDKTFNFDTWDKWAKSGSANPDIKILVGVPGSPSAAGSGYVPIDALSKAISQVSQSSSYGGVSVWDASQSYANTEASPNFAVALGQLVHSGAPSAGR